MKYKSNPKTGIKVSTNNHDKVTVGVFFSKNKSKTTAIKLIT